MNRYDNRLRILTEEYETLISRENKRIRSNNGIFERYKYPILTAAHTPLEWRYDFNPETNPFLWNVSVLTLYSMQELSNITENISLWHEWKVTTVSRFLP